MEQTPYGMQTQNFPKGGLLDNLCPSTAAPGGLGAEQEFPMFPKSRLSAVGISYCPVSQDFAGGGLSLIPNGSGKKGAPRRSLRQALGPNPGATVRQRHGLLHPPSRVRLWEEVKDLSF